MTFRGKVAVVTGAASGIGRATAELLANRGAEVVCVDLDSPEGVAEEIGGLATARELDITSESDWERFVAEHASRGAAIDYLVQSAGVFRAVDAVQESVEHWDRIVRVNLRGTWLGMKHVLPVMVGQGTGAIVNISSAAIARSTPSTPAYTASKSAVFGLTMQAAAQYARQGIRINGIAPGTVDTAMWAAAAPDSEASARLGQAIPIGRIARPDEIAATAAFLCSEEASYIVGQTIVVDGGWTISDSALQFG